jgi:hypothetical protein
LARAIEISTAGSGLLIDDAVDDAERHADLELALSILHDNVSGCR